MRADKLMREDVLGREGTHYPNLAQRDGKSQIIGS